MEKIVLIISKKEMNMMQFKRLMALVLCLSMALCLFGCDTTPEVTEPPVTEPVVTEPPAPDAAAVYADGIKD